MGSEVSRGCLIFYTTFLYQFCGNYNYSFLSAKKCLKMLKSTLGQNNLSLEVQNNTVTQFFGFFGGSIWVSDHCGARAPPNNFGNCYKKPIKTAKITKIPSLCPPNVQVPPRKFFRSYAPDSI